MTATIAMLEPVNQLLLIWYKEKSVRPSVCVFLSRHENVVEGRSVETAMQPAYGVQVSDLTYTAPGSAHKFCQGQSQLLSVVSVLI